MFGPDQKWFAVDDDPKISCAGISYGKEKEPYTRLDNGFGIFISQEAEDESFAEEVIIGHFWCGGDPR